MCASHVQLIDANSDAHLWAESYDRELTAANIFAIQSELASAIAGALKAALSPAEQTRVAAVPTQKPRGLGGLSARPTADRQEHKRRRLMTQSASSGRQ